MSSYLPIALDLRGRRCVVVGGGPVAQRKLEGLLAAGADDVLVVAPSVAPGIEAAAAPGVHVFRRAFRPEDLDGAFVAMAATDDPAVNGQLVAEARARGVLVNVADDPGKCDFIMPAVVRRGEVQVAITTGGLSPALARNLRERLEAELPEEYGVILDIIGSLRKELRQAGGRLDPERWQGLISGALEALRSGDRETAERLVRHRLGIAAEGKGRGAAPDLSPPPQPSPVQGEGDFLEAPLPVGGRVSVGGDGTPRPGRIVLVGAGPGDPGLITVAGRQAIAEADVIVYDRLVNPCLLEMARHNCKVVYVGKRAGGEGPYSQEEINQLLCAEARAGRVVVRLKGGDPFVFGRGGEEAMAAVGAGIPFTVIPGVTAATAVPAYAGIPVTYRGLSSGFTVLTGQSGQGAEAFDWEALARLGGTLVLLMAVEALAEITAKLLEAGMAASTPAAVVGSGSTPDQRVVLGQLGDIAERARHEAVEAPATTVIGEVAALAKELAWYLGGNEPAKPLAARTGPR